MNKNLKKFISFFWNFIPYKQFFFNIFAYLFYKKGNCIFSQEGEDLILSRLFYIINDNHNIKDGFYIDIGAHHPYRYSNTYLFYKKGWHGINIDALPGSMKSFNRLRKRDINIECGVGKKTEVKKFFVFNDPAVNTFNEKLALERSNQYNRSLKITKIVDVPTLPLSEILNKYLPQTNGKRQKIDFLSIDGEGLDFDILQSNDWEAYRPTIIVIEAVRIGIGVGEQAISIEDLSSGPIVRYMNSLDYVFYCKTIYSVFFIDKSFL